MLFENFPGNSKVWVYAADRFLTVNEIDFVQSNLNNFLEKWKTHGSELLANGLILHSNFIVIAADESTIKSSGCSVDSSVRFVKALGKELQVDFFNRLKIVIEKNGELKRIHFNDLSNYPDWNMFNPLVSDLNELRTKWLIPINEFCNTK